MQLDFAHRHILDTTFVSPTGKGTPKPVYRISTSRMWGIFANKTTIEFIGSDNPQNHRTVAQIIWAGASANTNFVCFGGHLYSFAEFLGVGKGFMNTDSFITFGNEKYTWRTYRFEPQSWRHQLYDSRGNQVAWYKHDPNSLFGPSALGYLRIHESLASNPVSLDALFTSFFIFMTTRNVSLPWKKKKPKFTATAEVNIGTQAVNNVEKEPQAVVQAVEPEHKADDSDGLGDKTVAGGPNTA